jgi:RNA recognition motif-containing protein
MGLRLYVGNLAFGTDEETLRTAFSQHGTVTEIKVITDRETGRSRGFAFVTLADEKSAANVMKTMDGAMVDGRALRVNEAEERAPRGGGGGGGGGRGGGGGGGNRW